ncbi:hypothetical protein HPB50_009797 [Hyalomma asiaticum]|uniref:Uncharacterized protein n=1 Tax=Hyalomma asiaticum TaxID=266040 RepID=A0ACB7SI43_HYAAI|nr:hypothetical protein HPB50_009797 [Hyalomma asiaticum]
MESPTDSHECKAKCKLCGKGHPMGDRTYQTPFIVRQRRKERIEESRRERQPAMRFADSRPIEGCGYQQRSQSATQRSESAGPRSRSGSRPGDRLPQATSAQKASGVKAQQKRSELCGKLWRQVVSQPLFRWRLRKDRVFPLVSRTLRGRTITPREITWFPAHMGFTISGITNSNELTHSLERGLTFCAGLHGPGSLDCSAPSEVWLSNHKQSILVATNWNEKRETRAAFRVSQLTTEDRDHQDDN